MPEVNDVIINPFPHGAFGFSERRRLGKQLRDNPLRPGHRAAQLVEIGTDSLLCGIPLRTGFVGELRYGLLNDARKLNKKNCR